MDLLGLVSVATSSTLRELLKCVASAVLPRRDGAQTAKFASDLALCLHPALLAPSPSFAFDFLQDVKATCALCVCLHNVGGLSDLTMRIYRGCRSLRMSVLCLCSALVGFILCLRWCAAAVASVHARPRTLWQYAVCTS